MPAPREPVFYSFFRTQPTNSLTTHLVNYWVYCFSCLGGRDAEREHKLLRPQITTTATEQRTFPNWDIWLRILATKWKPKCNVNFRKEKQISSRSWGIITCSRLLWHTSVNHRGHSWPTRWFNKWLGIGWQWHWFMNNIHWRLLQGHHPIRTRTPAKASRTMALKLKGFYGQTWQRQGPVTAPYNHHRLSDLDRQVTSCSQTAHQMTNT